MPGPYNFYMNISISHIAWPADQEEAFLKQIVQLGCPNLEVAAGRWWKNPLDVSAVDRRAKKQEMADRGIKLVAMQGLLFGRKDLALFADAATEARTIEYLKGLCQFASDLGIRNMVFGAPSNRRRDDLPMRVAFDRAVRFFRQLAQAAADCGTCVLIEPLAAQETDFIITAREGARLVEVVNHAGFALHLDAKSLQAEGKLFTEILPPVINHVKHVHINEGDLVELNTTGEVNHQGLAWALADVKYQGYVGIEMRTAATPEESVERSIRFVQATYK